MPGTTLEEWIGQEVLVALTEYSEPVAGTLTGVDDKGIAIRQSVVGGPRPVFYPWRFVAWVHPAQPEESGEPNHEGPIVAE
jgi:hypothetical protein